MSTSNEQVALHQEGRLELAIQAYKQGAFKSYRAAAKAYDVPRSTLQDRVAGLKPKRGSIATNRLLTPTEEETLTKWIIARDLRGMPPTTAAIRHKASLLLAEHQKPATVGSLWVYNFIKRTPTLKSKYNRKYDYQRAQCEDPELIRGWFQRVQRTKAEYGILDNDTYNFDETSF
jgi:hypothetical protein